MSGSSNPTSGIPSLPTIDVGHGITVQPLENDGHSIKIAINGLPCGSNFAIVGTDSSYGGFGIAVAPVSETINALWMLRTPDCITNPKIGG